MFVTNESTVEEFFRKTVNVPGCNRYTQTYIVDIFVENVRGENDLSNQSLTLLYKQAIDTASFERFKNIGDWLFFTRSIYPEHLTGASEEYYETLARSSYYTCYTMLNRQWALYEELADQFNLFTNTIKKSIRTPSDKTGPLLLDNSLF